MQIGLLRITCLLFATLSPACGSTAADGSSDDGGPPTAAPAGWTQWQIAEGGNDHWYGVVRSTASWESAWVTASGFSSNAYLVTITSAAEQAFVASQFLTGADALRVFWMGATGRAGDRVFSWETGEPFVYTNWKAGEPNNWSTDEFFSCINWNAVRGPIGEWNDVPVNGTTGYDGGANDGPYQALVESESVPRGM
jgi:hypothetical protein